ncbi:hypothetical protein PLICRDRAFT_44106 [Plicaturopsis crispa FD-325 SS-3]|nr:hypothetical protein PLICRDRAFT_44106 [Plicaturopsis crispa FD-325 SS-3]
MTLAMSPPQNTSMRLSILNVDALKSDDAIRIAVNEFETALRDGAFDALITQILSRPHLFEFLVSASDLLAAKVLAQFPSKHDEFISSTSAKILGKLSLSLAFLPHDFPPETFQSLRECRSSFDLALKVIPTVMALPFDAGSPIDACDEDEDEHLASMSNWIKQPRQKKKRTKRTVPLDMKVFDELGVQVPTTPQEAKNLAAQILQDQKGVLEFFLSILRRPELSSVVKALYIPPEDTSQSKLDPIHDQSTSDVPTIANESSCEGETPAAYPMVQPMKAALYFESAEGFGQWRILIAGRADAHLREARRQDASKFKIIIKKIKELSNGHFSDDNQKRLNGPNTEIPIYEAKMTRDLRLVYQVDCVPEYDSDVERQVIRIFGIYTHAQFDKRLWDSVGYQLGRKGKEYRRRCIYRKRPLHAGDNVFEPETWPPVEESAIDLTQKHLELPHGDLEELHSLLVLEKFVTFSQALLNSIIANQEVQHVFHVSSQEKEIIEHQHSCYVLGRSGTGKTTTMLFKMLGIERAWELHADDVPKPRQVFVTQSRVLAEKVEEYFSKLLQSLATASASLQDLAKLSKSAKNQREEAMLVDRDDEVNWRADLPGCFSELRDDHFPLFITFDQLSKLIEADIQSASQAASSTRLFFNDDESNEPSSPSVSLQSGVDLSLALGGQSMVSYDVFFQSYWPHFPQSLIKNLDPSLVYSEFMGVIKGSEQALAHPECYLDKDAYDNLSHRTQATFATQRDLIYGLFQVYLKRKRGRNDYDAADRTHTILKHLQEPGLLPRLIDYLYVDEAQDNLLIDALLLRKLCRNPDGLFWAGDTAQTISIGSSFRFNDLKAFLFRIEEQNSHHAQKTIEPPKSFQLAVNYRSHAGIVNCAHSVIELITEFWPYAIDILAQEKGIVQGLRPVFLGGWDQNTVRYEQFLFGDSGSPIEFGAQQCILVRDNAARERLRGQVGDIGLILTLYESKGLEFNDVLLYNFFQDSTVDLSQWRVVLNAVEASQRKSTPAPRFSETRHAGVCSELKFLYVAITRARKNMWIVDSSEKSEPMRIFWTSRDLVQNCTPGTDVPHLAVSSTAEEWATSGRSLFQNKRYLQAKHCFERASLPREVAVSQAYYLREEARAMPAGSRSSTAERMTAFLVAAEAFHACAQEANKEKTAYFRNAADCYMQGGDDLKAARAFVDAEDYTSATLQYRKIGMFDDAISVITTYQAKVKPDVSKRITSVARLFYFQSGELEKASALFPSFEDELEFMEAYDLDVQRASLLASVGRMAEAAELHLAEGRTLEAIHLFLKDGGNEVSMQRAKECLLDGLWQNLSFGVTAETASSNVALQQLLKLAGRLNPTLLEPSDNAEIDLFRAVVAKEANHLEELARNFYHVYNKPAAALLCLDHVFVNPPRILAEALARDVSRQLEMFLIYATLLRDFYSHSDPANNGIVQRLFGFTASTTTAHELRIRTGTFLHGLIASSRYAMTRQNEEDVFISDVNFTPIFKRELGRRLRVKVFGENEACRRAQAFSPCVSWAASGYCNRPGCPQAHVNATALDQDWYNSRVHIHLQQILIFHTLHIVKLGPEEEWHQRYWLDQLYDALHPPYFPLGTIANLNPNLSREDVAGFEVAKVWSKRLLYHFERRHRNGEKAILSTILKAASLSFTIDRAEASRFIVRTPLMQTILDDGFIRRGGGYIVEELIWCIHGNTPNSITMGIFSLKHIVEAQLPIDINLLCDLLDQICGMIALTHQYRKEAMTHQVTLPRSWLLTFSKSFDTNTPQNAVLFLNVFHNIAVLLLEQISEGQADADYLLYEKTTLTKVRFVIRHVFVARICRTICLLGYNINNLELRSKIVQAMRRLSSKSDRRNVSRLYAPYVLSRDWKDIAKAVQNPTVRSPMDEMILLWNRSVLPRSPPPLKDVRPIIVQTLRDVPSALEAPPFKPSTKVVSILRPSAAPFVPSSAAATTSTSANATQEDVADVSAGDPTDDLAYDPAEDDDGDEEENDVEETLQDEVADVDMEAPLPSSNVSLTEKPPSPEEIKAARIIERTYHQYVSRRTRATANGLAGTRFIIWNDCYQESQKMDWPHRYYRILFLGALPHVLVCLQTLQARVHASKAKVKRRMSKAQHIELEELMTLQTEVSTLFQAVNKLQKALDPKSSLHCRRDLGQLKMHVCKVQELCQHPILGHVVQQELQHDLKIVALFFEGKSQRKKEKPRLNVEDDLML